MLIYFNGPYSYIRCLEHEGEYELNGWLVDRKGWSAG